MRVNTPITPPSGELTITSGGIVMDAITSDGVRSLRTSDSVQSASADYSPGSSPGFALEGRNKHGIEGEVEACSLLRSLAGRGQAYSAPRKVEESAYPGVDCIVEGPTGTCKMQVRRAVDGDFRRKLATAVDRKVSYVYGSVDEAADAIREAIADKHQNLVVKRRIDIGQIDLVLDSRESLILVLDPAILASFRLRHEEWARGLGFRAVWLVGPAAPYVFQLA